MDKVKDEMIDEMAKSYLVQKHQRQGVEQNVTAASIEIDKLMQLNELNDDALNQLLAQAMQMSTDMGIDINELDESHLKMGMKMIELNDEEKSQILVPYFNQIATVDENGSWQDYMSQISEYAINNAIDLTTDPFQSLLTETEKNQIGQRVRDDYLMQKAHCDKYDYIIAAFCGVVCGLIDSFFVGMPGESKLGDWSDKQADKFVSEISKKLWGADEKKRNEILNLYANKSISKEQRNRMLKEAGIPYNQNLKKKPETIQQYIQYLEKKFNVNYDASSAAFVDENGVLGGMSPMNHHIMSLAHSPSIIGLIFSIIDQFTGKASFVDNGKLIRLTPSQKANAIDQFELRGSTFPTKLLCGFTNWLGHLCSDLVGANTTRADSKVRRGTGVPVPFTELLQFCTFEVPDGKGEKISISELTIKIFENGYDLRFGIATAIPVLLNEFMIRLLWSLKSRFYHKNDWCDSIPFGNHPELRRMLLAGHGALCLVDAVDAGIRSVDMITFIMHLNVTAWARLGVAGVQEIRALYKENVVDVVALDEDLEMEWARWYESTNI